MKSVKTGIGSANKKTVLTIEEWIDKLGVEEVSKVLGVERSTVRHWRRGFVLPRTDQMKQIKKYSHGAVTYASIIDGQNERKNKYKKALLSHQS